MDDATAAVVVRLGQVVTQAGRLLELTNLDYDLSEALDPIRAADALLYEAGKRVDPRWDER